MPGLRIGTVEWTHEPLEVRPGGISIGAAIDAQIARLVADGKSLFEVTVQFDPADGADQAATRQMYDPSAIPTYEDADYGNKRRR